MLSASLYISLSLFLLYLGAEWLVKASSRLALMLKISPLIIGLTIVAFGTSAPELLVSLSAALKGNSDIAIGNVVGSNIFNIAFILGLSAIISPMVVKLQILKVDCPIAVGLSILCLWLFNDGLVSRVEGAGLVLFILVYTILNIILARREKAGGDTSSAEPQIDIDPNELHNSKAPIFKCIFWIIAGLGLLVLGSDLLVNNAIFIARQLNISEAVIGLTIVAAGTSVPELATSVLAAFKKQADLAIGNIIGSNIFNIACILGISSLVTPISTAQLKFLDLFTMILVAVLLQIFLMTRMKLERWEGVILVAGFLLYLTQLWPQEIS